MFYYKVVSSHWPNTFEFKSDIELKVGQCFRIKKHDGWRDYPTRFRVEDISDEQHYVGTVVTIFEVDTEVESF